MIMPMRVWRWRENLYTFSTFVVLSKHGIHGLDVFLSYTRSDDPNAGIGQLGLEIALQFLSMPLGDEREVPNNAPNGRISIAP